MTGQIDFLLELMDFVEEIKRDTHEESVKFSRLNALQTMIKKQLEDVCKVRKQTFKGFSKKHNFSEEELEYLSELIDYKNMCLELIDPVEESKETKIDDETYVAIREAFIDFTKGISYGYTLLRWDKTYTEQPLAPNSKNTFKFKNWVECFHCVSDKKIKPEEFIPKALETKEKVLKWQPKKGDA